MPILYKTKVKHLEDTVFAQLVRLSNGVRGSMLKILLNQPLADVYFWVANNNKTVISWASVSENTASSLVTGEYERVREINLYTHKKYRGQGYAGDIIKVIKTDYVQDLSLNRLMGHGWDTSLIKRNGLRSF